MGLDMHLEQKIYVGSRYDEMIGEINIKKKDKKIPINFDETSYIVKEAAYWRKANQIHKWFVDNVQEGIDDCKSYYVSKNKLEDLLEICKEVVEKAIVIDGEIKNGEIFKDGKWAPNIQKGKIIQNAEEISKILPTEEGFFFGSTEYNEYYLEDVKDTIEKLESVLKYEKELNDLGVYSDFEYCSSW